MLLDFGEAAVAERRERFGVHVVRSLVKLQRTPQPRAGILPVAFAQIETGAQGQPAHEPDLLEPPRYLDLHRTIKRHACDVVLPVQHVRSEEHTSELQSRLHLVCRLLLEKKKTAGLPARVLRVPLEAFRVFFFNDTATTEIYTLSLHDALPISPSGLRADRDRRAGSTRPRTGSP